jgi:hypothetical protein
MKQQKGRAALGVCMVVLGVLEGLTGDYISAAVPLLIGVFFLFESHLGWKMKNERLRKTLALLSGSMMLVCFVIWIISLFLDVLG